MSNEFFTLRKLPSVALLIICASIATSASAQNLGVAGNQINISIPGSSFSTSATLTAPGTVSAVTGIPSQSTGSLIAPKFTFTLEQDGSANGSSGTYAAGIIIDEDSSQRRLEVFIPGISLSFDGSGNLTGTLTTPSVNIYGRDSTGTVLASTTVASAGSVNFNGNSLSFSAADQIALIQAQPGILADIVTSINNAGLTYSYTVVLAKTGGTANYSFGLNAAGAFSAFQGAGAAEFNIGGAAQNGVDATALDPGQKLTGTLSFTNSTGGGGGGGGGGSTTGNDNTINAGQTALQNELDAAGPPSADLITQVNSTAAAVAAEVKAGTASPTTLFGVLDTLNKSLGKQDGSTPTGSTAATLASITNVVSALNGVTLTTEQKAEFLGKITSTLANTASNIQDRGESQAGTGFSDILRNLGGSLTAAADVLNGGIYSNSLVAASKNVSAAVILNEFYATSLPQKAFQLTSIVLRHAASSTGVSAGISGSGAGAISNDQRSATHLNALNGENTRIEVTEGVVSTVTDALLAVINTTGATAQFDSDTSVTEIRAGDITVPTFLIATSVVGEHIADGFITAADGGLIAVKDGVAGTYVPAPRDVNGLIVALEQAGITVTIEADGSLYLVSDTGAKFSATFAFEDVATGVLGSAAVTFTPATGNPKDPGHKLRVTYSDGSVQSLVPYVAANDFYSSLVAQNIDVATDRATGIITGPDGIRLRPDYFINNVTASDLTYLAANKDSYGIAYRVSDVDGDGVSDLEVITAEGKQTLYGLN